jgi:hypothetical protein
VSGVQEAKRTFTQQATLTQAVDQNTLNEIDARATQAATEAFEVTRIAEEEPSYQLYVKQFHVLSLSLVLSFFFSRFILIENTGRNQNIVATTAN